MTIHASKGLEFEYVFITGLEYGLFPSQQKTSVAQTIEEMEEERRLFYVALTRAKKKLFLTHTELRMIFGSKQINVPSEFIEDIPEHLIENTVADTEGNRKVIVYM
jgi:DNA helicase-2/ATP-dependent DNA helicase PcrA